MNERYLAPSVKKAFDILRIISLSREGIGLNEIARALGIAKSTVHGIISALEDVGAVKRDPSTRRYELGLTLFELGRQIYTQIDLREIARPVMEELMEKVQETIFLGTLNGDRKSIVVLDIDECGHHLKITYPEGLVKDIGVLDTVTENNALHCLLAQKTTETGMNRKQTTQELKNSLELVLLPF